MPVRKYKSFIIRIVVKTEELLGLVFIHIHRKKEILIHKCKLFWESSMILFDFVFTDEMTRWDAIHVKEPLEFRRRV